ncbi:Uncharacterised protein [Raoultella terrigena]|uniref:Uncharacterized protein n=1 Tax=Raoultella terrigena TaxID=577 RepID=A0A4U9CYS3_RAOTE|nr:hypothetical protein RTE01_18880 [Raoultella terrigena]VTN09942.1 Uncharacterised protein [Raoultella terrigena]VUD31740.1 lipoprotein [Raoultella sp. NCTC 9187]HCR60023.1 hypothetical protein [Raoultella sp.]
MHLILRFRYYHHFFVSVQVAIEVMSKAEAVLLAIVLIILTASLWFIFSGEIWSLVSYLETQLYPSLVAPE